MLRQHERIYDLTQVVRAVVLGGSIRQTVMRSVMTAMTLAAGLRGQPFAVDKSVDDLARVVQQTLGRDADQLLRAMVENGIVSATEAGLQG
jgi:fructose-1-phosphate kinase PfkB-like protein